MSRTAKRPARPDPQMEADAFNHRVKLGQFVDYREVKDQGPVLRMRTRTEAQVLSGHTAVVWLEGKSGCVAVSHCTPVDPYEIQMLTSDHYTTLLIEGHVDAGVAMTRAIRDGYTDYPTFQHGHWRYTDAPEEEGGPDAYSTWREPCKPTDKGAEPVTFTQRNW